MAACRRSWSWTRRCSRRSPYRRPRGAASALAGDGSARRAYQQLICGSWNSTTAAGGRRKRASSSPEAGMFTYRTADAGWRGPDDAGRPSAEVAVVATYCSNATGADAESDNEAAVQAVGAAIGSLQASAPRTGRYGEPVPLVVRCRSWRRRGQGGDRGGGWRVTRSRRRDARRPRVPDPTGGGSAAKGRVRR